MTIESIDTFNAEPITIIVSYSVEITYMPFFFVTLTKLKAFWDKHYVIFCHFISSKIPF